jgi:hypothetical protein
MLVVDQKKEASEIELFFDASIKEDFVLTYGTVQLNASIGEKIRSYFC